MKFYSTFKSGKTIPDSSVDYILNILDGGKFLKGISYEWLDSIKFSINNEVIGLLKSFFEQKDIISYPEKVIRIGDIVLRFDCIDQDAVILKIKTLTEIGKIHIAKSVFNIFIADYKKSYDEKFPLSFEKFISS